MCSYVLLPLLLLLWQSAKKKVGGRLGRGKDLRKTTQQCVDRALDIVPTKLRRDVLMHSLNIEFS